MIGVQFEGEHHFNGVPAQVAAVLGDPRFDCQLDLPDVGPPTLLTEAADDRWSHFRMRYEYTGPLDPVARRLLTPRRLAWVQKVAVDRSSCSGELAFHAEADPRRLRGWAQFTLSPDGDRCIRRLRGELTVSLPLIGREAERRIVPGLLRRLDIEAVAVNRALQRQADDL
jgi:hypothetical protein